MARIEIDLNNGTVIEDTSLDPTATPAVVSQYEISTYDTDKLSAFEIDNLDLGLQVVELDQPDTTRQSGRSKWPDFMPRPFLG